MENVFILKTWPVSSTGNENRSKELPLRGNRGGEREKERERYFKREGK